MSRAHHPGRRGLAAESSTHRMLRTLGLQHLTRNGLHAQLRTLWPEPATRWSNLTQLLNDAEDGGYVAHHEGRWHRTEAGHQAVQRLAGGMVAGPGAAAAPAAQPLPPSPDPEPLAATSPPPSAPRRSASRADLAPSPLRVGADRAQLQPSRMGNRLLYRDGRVTDLNGQPLAA